MRGLRKAIVFGALAAAVGMSGGANGAESLKPKVKAPKLEPLPKEKFAELRGQLGACIVARNNAMAKKYLENSDSLTVDYKAMDVDPKRAMFMFRMDACTKYNVPQMAQPVFMTPGALRNLLLEATYLEQVKSKPQVALDENGQPIAAPARRFASTDGNLAPAAAFAAIADCAVAKDAGLADAVLRTGAGLPEERAAAVALAPVIGECVPAGQNVELTPTSIRALAAEGLWQRFVFASAQ